MAIKRFSAGNSDAATLIKQAVDIVDVVAQVVPLRRVGNRYLGLCPFHQEKTASFQVDAENQLFYCFGCGNGGDVLSFVMKQQNLSFGEALEYLADRYHIPLPRPEDSQPARETKQELEELHHVVEMARSYFYGQLHHSAEGDAARRYIVQRGLPDRVVEEQQLGYAPNRWDGLLTHLKRSGIDLQVGLKAGLLAASANDRHYDRFRHRLIFPITNERGRPIAFGGRSLDGSEPKYLNSPETPLYHKGRTLYNLGRAREACRQQRQLVLVEGYMDLLAFHSQGFYRVVATLGTALTMQQVRLLARIADEVVLVYDADAAGEKAMLRALPLFLQEQLPVTCPKLPANMDPDDFLKAEGIAGFEKLLQDRQDLGKIAVDKTLSGWDGTSAGKARVVEELQPLLDCVRQPVLQAEYVRLMAERLALSEQVIRQQLRVKPWREKGAQYPAHAVAKGSEPAGLTTQTLEESILGVLVKYPSLMGRVKTSGALEHFQVGRLQALAEVLLRVEPAGENGLDAALVYDQLPDPETRQLFTRLLLREDCYGGVEAACLHLEDRLGALQRRQCKFNRKDLLEAIRRAEQQGDAARVGELLRQLHDLCCTR